MKKLFLFALPLLLISCKGAEQYRAGIEELSGKWDTTSTAITNFAGTVSSDLTNYTKALAGVQLDDMVAKKMTADQTAAYTAAQQNVTSALSAYQPLQKTIGDYLTTWTEKSAELTALKDGLTSGKIEGDVPAKMAELNAMVDTGNNNLAEWQGTYATIKGNVDSAMASLTQLMGSFAAGK